MPTLHLRKSTIVMLVLLAVSGLLNLASWYSSAFADWYVGNLFPIITSPLAHLTALLPFSLGEWMLLAAVIWLLVLLITLLVRLLCCAAEVHVRKKVFLSPSDSLKTDAGETSPGTGNDNGDACAFSLSARNESGPFFLRFSRRYLRATCWLVSVVLLVMTLNCFLLYHVTPLEQSLPGYGKEYTIDELGRLRDYIVEQCNTLSEVVPRDSLSNEVIYEGGFSAMAETAGEAMANLARREDIVIRTAGWTTTVKPLHFSDFVSQQYIQGYYFPFSMEANINTVMKIMNQPSTMCHELSHTHGYIYEDEANLIGFLACIYSDDLVFQYSGWLSVLNYVNNSFYANVDKETYQSHTSISDLVRWDNEFLSEEAWEGVEEDAILSTETVKAATDVYLDTTLKANGVESGKASYTHVVELILMYYDGQYPDQD